jgi:hypothetical protein
LNVCLVKNKKGHICLGSDKAQLEKLRAKTGKPGTGSLFEIIKSLVKLANVSGVCRISKARRLRHVHVFIKKAMQKCILYINLSKIPTLGDSK